MTEELRVGDRVRYRNERMGHLAWLVTEVKGERVNVQSDFDGGWAYASEFTPIEPAVPPPH